MTSPLRLRMQRRSTPILRALSAAPKWLIFVAVLALIAGGLLIGGPLGAVPLGVLVLILGWLTALGWPVLRPGQRWVRVLTIAVIALVVVSRLGQG